MFTKQAQAIGNTLFQAGVPAQQAAALQGLFGQCRAPLEHRGPVKFDYTRQSMRQILPNAIFPPGLSPLSYPSLSPGTQTFPEDQSDFQPSSPPPEDDSAVSASGGSAPNAFAPPETSVNSSNFNNFLGSSGQYAATQVVGDGRRIEVTRQGFPGLSVFRVTPLNIAPREFVTDVFIDDNSLIVEKRKYFVWLAGESNPTATPIAQFRTIMRVEDVREEGAALVKDRSEISVLTQGEDSPSGTQTIIQTTECP